MIKTVVFDLGGVLLDWNPRYLLRKLIADADEIERFLDEVCTREWHEQQDAGRSCADAIAERISLFPAQAPLIRAFYDRFDEMIASAFEDTVAVLSDLHQSGVPLYALSNWPGDTFHHAKRFAFMDVFRGVVVSGFEGVKKPDARIFHILLERYGLEAKTTLFIDDVAANITAAQAVGLQGHHFQDPKALRESLVRHGLIP